MTKTLLFVDDEANLLSGLRRMLRVKHDVWDMHFAEGGEAALAILAQRPVDVVVSDMRMPGMDGGELLTRVGRLYPGTARIILSGHADRAMIISAVGPTQQFLAKPCEVDMLIQALDGVFAVRDLIEGTELRDLLGGVQSLPKPPAVYDEMVALSADPESDLDDVIRVVERDVSTSAEVLRLVNTAFFGLPSRVPTVARAVGLLGLETIQGLALAGAVFGSGARLPPGIDAKALSDRGLLVGSLARRFAAAEGWSREAIGQAFFSGLLHEIGLPVLACANPVAWSAVQAQLESGQGSASGPISPLRAEHDAQIQHFGCSVSAAGAYLLGLWGFDASVVQAVAGQPTDDENTAASALSMLLFTARQLARDPGGDLFVADSGYLSEERLATWRDKAAELLEPAQ